jgi:glycosyltransferase involved in cell wall biosynthesis
LRKAKPDWILEVVTAENGPLTRQLARLDFPVSVLPLPESLARFGEASSGNLLSLAAGLAGALKYRGRLKRFIALSKPDIVHTLNFKMHLLGACARVPGAKLCWHVHDFIGNRSLTKKLLRFLSTRVHAVVAISESVARDARANLKCPERVRTVLNAIDLEHFSPGGKAAQLRGGSSEGASVGLIATFARWKGHEVFLRAIAALPCRVNAYVVGGALYRTPGSQASLDSLRSCAEALGIGDRVTFTGFVEDTAPTMRALDVVVHASTEPEPFGLVIAEAMACGRAVVASMAGGAAEILQPGVDGLGHAPGDADALARAIELLIEQPALRRQYGDAARRSAEALFDPARMAREMIDVYEAI